jgi:cytoskeletal protein RodZ
MQPLFRAKEEDSDNSTININRQQGNKGKEVKRIWVLCLLLFFCLGFVLWWVFFYVFFKPRKFLSPRI